MKRAFYKYQGTGNDFILFDDREETFNEKDEQLIARLCDRRMGIGADGLMLLRNETGFDFRMVYVNADGKPSSMCGNGSRCLSRFAKDIGAISKKEISFLAVDGPHEALIDDQNVSVHMQNVNEIEAGSGYFYLNTGSPHYVSYSDSVREIPVKEKGAAIRYNDRFRNEGTNVNFVQQESNGIFVRTYERGVEDETLSCGTGVVASALTAHLKGEATSDTACLVFTRGGNLEVKFEKNGSGYKNIWLIGPAQLVYKGEIEL
jgi:diaminopimelate epimerase